ncbi:MAG: LysR family transcriptional regulator [Lachnospiraceae bacterium]|nr:LysR family transcriptional regulator [Lachnospiraceae bacterium]
MTIAQLKYVTEVAKTKSINATAHSLYISQSGLSTAIKDLEEELGITIFNRTNRGISITREGETFIRYASNVLLQYKLMEDKYFGDGNIKKSFSVSMHHSTFATKIFSEIVKEYGLNDYEYSLYETTTKNVLDNIVRAKSELGILYISSFNREYYERVFKEANLFFEPLGTFPVCAYVGDKHPLADRKEISLEELEEYPCLLFDQDENSSFYFYEEIISTYEYKNVIRTSDRGTTLALIRELDGYSVGIGTFYDKKYDDGLTAVSIKTSESIDVGYIKRMDTILSDIAEKYIELFKKYIDKLKNQT